MDYYDGNTVTGMWNYAQHYAIDDNSFGTTFGPSAPGAINVASGDTGGVDTTPRGEQPERLDEHLAERRHHRRWKRRLLAHERRTALLGRLLDARRRCDERHEHRRRAEQGRPLVGLVRGRFPAHDLVCRPRRPQPATRGSRPRTFIPDEFSGAFTGKVVPTGASNEALCDADHPVGVALGGTGQWGYKDDYIPHHEPFQFYASTANPHHLTIPTDSSGNDTLDGLKTVGPDTQSLRRRRTPQFNTPNHNYDTSDFDQLVAAINAGKLPASALPGGHLPEGAGLRGRPRRLLRAGRRAGLRRRTRSTR